ncbi:hypothetical protein JCM10207_006790 [Rhodosporidiobolus poonsookiae]
MASSGEEYQISLTATSSSILRLLARLNTIIRVETAVLHVSPNLPAYALEAVEARVKQWEQNPRSAPCLSISSKWAPPSPIGFSEAVTVSPPASRRPKPPLPIKLEQAPTLLWELSKRFLHDLASQRSVVDPLEALLGLFLLKEAGNRDGSPSTYTNLNFGATPNFFRRASRSLEGSDMVDEAKRLLTSAHALELAHRLWTPALFRQRQAELRRCFAYLLKLFGLNSSGLVYESAPPAVVSRPLSSAPQPEVKSPKRRDWKRLHPKRWLPKLSSHSLAHNAYDPQPRGSFRASPF